MLQYYPILLLMLLALSLDGQQHQQQRTLGIDTFPHHTRVPEFPGYVPNPFTLPPYTGKYDSTIYTTSPGLKMKNCPSSCSYNGYCSNGTQGHCICNNGFVGVDCSQRVCPSGRAWFDIPDSNSIAHRDYTECSNMGTCDRLTGTCQCRFGFTGAACDQLVCPFSGSTGFAEMQNYTDTAMCSGNGQCMSKRQIAKYKDYVHTFNLTDYNGWDGDMIYGCYCSPGWSGVACDKRTCAFGFDPLNYTFPWTPSVDQVQLLECSCGFSDCSGGIRLKYKEAYTGIIPALASSEGLKYMLNQVMSYDGTLKTSNLFSVKLLVGSTICSAEGSLVAITFRYKQPPLEFMLEGNMATGYVNIISKEGILPRYSIPKGQPKYYAVEGNRVATECSSRGVCDRYSGSCKCYSGFTSSNGIGGRGSFNDCGFQEVETSTGYDKGVNATLSNVRCPVVDGLTCSGHGYCVQPRVRGEDIAIYGMPAFERHYRWHRNCSCDIGYYGQACEFKSCPVGINLYGDVGVGYPRGKTSNFSMSACSGVGYCNTTTGSCDCWGLFEGSACEKMKCAYDEKYNDECGLSGYCVSLREAAQLRSNEDGSFSPTVYSEWDADWVRGCFCTPYDKYQAPQFEKSPDDPEYLKISNASFNFKGTQTNFGSIVKKIYYPEYYRGPYAFTHTTFKGYACTRATCPTGDYPFYRGGVNEVQMLKCKAQNGTFTLKFRNSVSEPISYLVSATRLKAILEKMLSITKVQVTVGESSLNMPGPVQYPFPPYPNERPNVGTGGLPICDAKGDYPVFIEFLSELGDVPMLEPDVSNLLCFHGDCIDPYGHYDWRPGENFVSEFLDYVNPSFISTVTITEYQKGTKGNYECSRNGICMEDTGKCRCAPGFKSSNGSVLYPGERGDCTYYDKYHNIKTKDQKTTEVPFNTYPYK